MKKYILFSLAGMAVLPHLLFAGTDCSVKEYPDHYLATCVGDEKAVSGAQQTMGSTKPAKTYGLNPDTMAVIPSQTVQPTIFTSSPKVESQKEPVITMNEESSEQNPTLSKRNRAKIEAIHMKELKRKAQEENAP